MYPCGEFDQNATILLVRGIEGIERGHHWRKIRLALSRDVGAAAQTAAQGFQIKMLKIGKLVRQKLFMPEKLADVLFLRIRISDTGVICAKAYQQLFITHGKTGSRQRAVVPHDRNPTIRAQDARKFATRRFWPKPMEGLAHSDEVNAETWKRGGFR